MTYAKAATAAAVILALTTACSSGGAAPQARDSLVWATVNPPDDAALSLRRHLDPKVASQAASYFTTVEKVEAEVLDAPAHGYTRRLLASVPATP
ncbi:hypothetical protein [Streptosporangium roseum]|uniref:hypothetical protein n=1 Tax=Streptosporangium roseum TaxID=2001 RepID=UPI00331C4285